MEAERATVVEADAEVEGKLTGRDARVLGRFRGQIELSGKLSTGEGSRVEAKVRAESAEVAGELVGEVYVKRLVVLEKGRVEGAVHAEVIAVREGARIDGAVNASGAPPKLGPEARPIVSNPRPIVTPPKGTSTL